jgi:GLPGLI family protein
MKKYISILICFFPLALMAQETEGYVRYLITHNWTKKMEAVDYISKQQKERLSYIWGSRSEWKKFANFYFNATETKYEDSEESADDDDGGYAWRKEAFSIRHNYATNTEKDVVTLLEKAYIIEDSIKGPEWKILNDMKEVAGHICMNAVYEDTIKMQKITAWFALDMPVSGGPERLCGLPGLILEVDVNNGAMTIVADKIEMKKLGTEMDMPKKIKGKKINEAQYTELLRKYIAEKRKNEEPPFWGMRY